jgi:DNA-binding MarR family transcriptional regulator
VVRQAARHVTQFYDQVLAPTGLRTTQFSILVKLRRLGPMSINTLAAEMVLDRTTLGRNIQPLERDGLILVKPKAEDRRTKELHLSESGVARLRAGIKLWAHAQSRFETAYGPARAGELRDMLRAVVATEFAAAPAL